MVSNAELRGRRGGGGGQLCTFHGSFVNSDQMRQVEEMIKDVFK